MQMKFSKERREFSRTFISLPLCALYAAESATRLARVMCLADVSASVVQFDFTVRSTNVTHMSLLLVVIHSRDRHVPDILCYCPLL